MFLQNIAALAKQDIINISPINNSILIRITDPQQPLLELKYPEKYNDILILKFLDTNNKNEDGAFLLKDAMTILNFIDKNKNAENIFVHCDFGQSRSPAIAQSLAKRYDFDDTNIIYSHDEVIPNKLVLSIMDMYLDEFSNSKNKSKDILLSNLNL
jgi:predicted protein tyrosine phosphatase